MLNKLRFNLIVRLYCFKIYESQHKKNGIVELNPSLSCTKGNSFVAVQLQPLANLQTRYCIFHFIVLRKLVQTDKELTYETMK